jgi:hypothetical protein
VFPIFSAGTMKWFGKTYRAPEHSGGFTGDLSRNGYPLYAKMVKNAKVGKRFGPCCSNIEACWEFECEHSEGAPPGQTKDRKADEAHSSRHKLFRTNGLKIWGTQDISTFRDVLIKIYQKKNPIGSVHKTKVAEYRDAAKICAGKVKKAQDLKRWKESIIDHFDNEILPIAERFVLVNSELLTDRLSVAAKSQYETLVKGLKDKSFGDYSGAISEMSPAVSAGVLGIANHIAAEMDGEYCIGAVCLMKIPAQYKIRAHKEVGPFRNPTVLVLEGTAKLHIKKRTNGKGVTEDVQKMYFGESRPGETIVNTDEKIVLKSVDLRDQEHEIPGVDHGCVWVSVNFFRLVPPGSAVPIATVSPRDALLSEAEEENQKQFLQSSYVKPDVRVRDDVHGTHIVCLLNKKHMNVDILNMLFKFIENRSIEKVESENVPDTDKVKVRVMPASMKVDGHFFKRVEEISDFFDQDKVMCPFLVEQDQWTLCVVNFSLKRFEYYDWDSNKGVAQDNINSVRDHLKRWIDFSTWTEYIPELGKQVVYNYGVLVCIFADYLAQNLEVDVTLDEANIMKFRLKMVRDIRKGFLQ